MAKGHISDVPNANEFGQLRSHLARGGVKQAEINEVLGQQVNGRTWRDLRGLLITWSNRLPKKK